MKKYIKLSILLIFIILLSLPAIQRQFHIFKSSPLNGAFENTKLESFTTDKFLNNTFQTAFEQNLSDSIGFKSTFVRIYNQVDYSLFNISHAKKVVVGTDDVLYEDYYIDSYYGKDYLGYNVINEKVQKFSKLQQLLSAKGIYLFLAITPSKTSLYPNNFPKQFISKKDTTNYDKTVELLKKYNCKYIDLKEVFLELNKNSKYPLFPKQGIHWSGYGITLAADTLFKYLSKNTNIQFNEIVTQKGELTSSYRVTDNDIGDASNLLFKPVNDKLYYPNISFKKTSNNSPDVLVIGDSFTNGFWKFYPYFQNLFNDESRFWYYNEEIIWPENLKGTKIASLDLFDEVKKRKIILIVSSEQNIGNLSFSFIDKTFDVFNNKRNFIDNKLNFYSTKIKNDKQWLKSIEEKAIQNNISTDEMILLDAKWLCKQDIIKYYTDSIGRDSIWKSNTIIKANKNNIPLDSMMYIEAEYMFKTYFEKKIKKENTDKLVQDKIEEIRNNIEWFNNIKEKAIKNNISIDEQLKLDAIWAIEHP